MEKQLAGEGEKDSLDAQLIKVRLKSTQFEHLPIKFIF